jgi:hypothetical protein
MKRRAATAIKAPKAVAASPGLDRERAAGLPVNFCYKPTSSRKPEFFRVLSRLVQ